MLVLFTDSDSDMTPELAKEYGYKTIISMPYIVDGKAIFPYKDFDNFDAKAFYDMLRTGVIPTTCALNTQEYIDYFEPELKAGNDILYVHFSRAMSCSFEAMDLAIAQLKKTYPDRTVYEIDTKAITVGSLNINMEIGKMFLAGKSVEEMIEWSKTEVDKFAIYFFADTLSFFKKSGRVTGISAVMGEILGIKPIITMGSDGIMKNISKVRGRKNALIALCDLVEKLGENVKDHTLVISNTDAMPLVEMLKEMLYSRFGNDLKIMVNQVNPTAGSHCGPDSLGICFHAIHR